MLRARYLPLIGQRNVMTIKVHLLVLQRSISVPRREWYVTNQSIVQRARHPESSATYCIIDNNIAKKQMKKKSSQETHVLQLNGFERRDGV